MNKEPRKPSPRPRKSDYAAPERRRERVIEKRQQIRDVEPLDVSDTHPVPRPRPKDKEK